MGIVYGGADGVRRTLRIARLRIYGAPLERLLALETDGGDAAGDTRSAAQAAARSAPLL
jgi:hypothetical protein